MEKDFLHITDFTTDEIWETLEAIFGIETSFLSISVHFGTTISERMYLILSCRQGCTLCNSKSARLKIHDFQKSGENRIFGQNPGLAYFWIREKFGDLVFKFNNSSNGNGANHRMSKI